MIFAGLFGRRRASHAIDTAYAAIVAQARHPRFYRDLGVPDTVEGRFEMIALHAFLLFHRFKGEGEDARAFGQDVFDRMFADMDASLREMGVGDLSVPKRIRRMAEAFYGRVAAYEAGLDAQGAGELEGALARNVLAGGSGARALALYMRRAAADLRAMPVSLLTAGRLGFPDPEAAALREGGAMEAQQ